MPFDWEGKNISHIQVVHEEVFFPKALTELISPNYDAKINGIDVFKSNIQIDDYSDEDGRMVHIILLQDHVKFFKNMIKKELAKQGIEPLPDKMYFELIPNNEITFPISVLTTNGDYRVDLSWDPKEIMPGSETRFIYTIRNGISLDLMYNSNFDFIISKDSKQIHKSSESARIGGGFVDFVFPTDDTYTITFDKKIFLLISILLPTLFGIIAITLGQDNFWDLRNYHYYNPYALMHGRFLTDIQVSQLQTYFNPTLDLLFYSLIENFHPKVATFLMAFIQGINGPLIMVLFFILLQKKAFITKLIIIIFSLIRIQKPIQYKSHSNSK